MSNDHLKIGSKSYAFAWGEKAGKKVVLFLCKDANDTNWKVGMASLEGAWFLSDTLENNLKILRENADHCFSGSSKTPTRLWCQQRSATRTGERGRTTDQ